MEHYLYICIVQFDGALQSVYASKTKSKAIGETVTYLLDNWPGHSRFVYWDSVIPENNIGEEDIDLESPEVRQYFIDTIGSGYMYFSDNVDITLMRVKEI